MYFKLAFPSFPQNALARKQ